MAVLCACHTAAPEVSETPTVIDYDPPSSLVVPETVVTHAKFPFVDVHNHQWQMPTQDLDLLVDDMDALNMAVMVNLSGRVDDSEEFLRGALANVASSQPARFLVFTNISFEGIDDPDWGTRTASQLAEDVAAGAAGLKIYKSLGMSVVDDSGQRVRVDDERIDPIWRMCAQLDVPVLIHSADPAQFWQPWDGQNERWYELYQKPGRKQDPTRFTWEEVMAEQHRVFARHPGTTFINAHLGWLANDLEQLGGLLDRYPNVYTEIGAVLAELGRQPRFARAWLERYQDRVLFGKDAWAPDEYHVYFRVLETADEYFDYYRRRHAFWKMYGLNLGDKVLRKLYYKNALRLFPKLDRSLFPAD
ncbi:MAG: putative TIM-barrel fold metal-dependent hydrolase [Chlamydiales bacterium]|jgi:predicted TIM-barrel fold metal-dependent hydrolase